MAFAQGVPLRLLPAVLVARYQHPYLVVRRGGGVSRPADLEGRRVGIRSWTVTTVMWLKSILANDHDVDLTKIDWVTFEDAHVANFPDPPGVERAAAGSDLKAMLKAGDLDAAVLTGRLDEPDLMPLIAGPEAAAAAWSNKYGAIQLNHLVTVKAALCEKRPDVVREVYRCLEDSHRRAGGANPLPFGPDANRRNLEVAIDATFGQGLIGKRFAPEDLYAPGILSG